MNATFERIEPVSKKIRVVALLREAILSGRIKRGEEIVEAKPARKFGVGQGLVREASIDPEAAREVSRDFLVRMKDYPGTCLVPGVRGPVA